ncbi:MAG: iron-containing alcohol dehydrogenase [Chloroflexi bacterium]|nr:MAG: iron-containing alcohol dehydrogenase [Chloroflexota bacterium]
MRFEFATATRIIFGAGVLAEVGTLATAIGEHAFVVVDGSLQQANPLLEYLTKSKVQYTEFAMRGEPTIDIVRDGVDQLKSSNCDMVISIGGGSIIDAGKAVAALVTNEGDLLDYLEVIGAGKSLVAPPLPFIAIPTTAGTGAEVTRNAVIASPEHQVKVSLRSPLMLANIALVDPELTYSIPQSVTAATGLDALTQVIEPYVSNRANPLTDAVAKEGITLAARSLLNAYRNGNDVDARRDMSLASLFGGLALANSKLGAVHGFAGPIGGMFHAPHGAVCARLLPFVMETNVKALQQREPDNPALKRYDDVARLLTGDAYATAADGVMWIQALCSHLEVAPFASYGISESDFPVIVEKAAVASSMQGNPIKLTTDELREILVQAL